MNNPCHIELWANVVNEDVKKEKTKPKELRISKK